MPSEFYDLGPCARCGSAWSRLGPIDKVRDVNVLLAEFACWQCGDRRYFSISNSQRRALLGAER
jgi:hypothetical protein